MKWWVSRDWDERRGWFVYVIKYLALNKNLRIQAFLLWVQPRFSYFALTYYFTSAVYFWEWYIPDRKRKRPNFLRTNFFGKIQKQVDFYSKADICLTYLQLSNICALLSVTVPNKIWIGKSDISLKMKFHMKFGHVNIRSVALDSGAFTILYTFWSPQWRYVFQILFKLYSFNFCYELCIILMKLAFAWSITIGNAEQFFSRKRENQMWRNWQSHD